MPARFAGLTATQIKALSPSQTVFFFPVGILEDHGPHLPVGLDVAEAERLSGMAAERLEKELPGWMGIIMPPLCAGVDGNTTELSVGVRAHVLRDWLVDSCQALAHHGFRHFVCFSGTLGPRHLTAIEEAGKIIAGNSRWKKFLGQGASRAYLASASSALVTPKQVWDSPLLPNPAEHGGKRDTSVAMELGIQVDPRFAVLPAEKGPPRSVLALGIMRKRRKLGGYWGKPSDASLEEGKRVLAEMLSDVYPKLRAAWEGASANMLFRSWYSVVPLNKSFFKAWAMVFVLLILLIVWVSWSIQFMLS